MKKRLNCIIAIILVMVMMFSNGMQLLADTVTVTEYDGTASDWALPELREAEEYGLTYDKIMCNFTSNINREEFCTIVVKLYEKLSGQKVESGPSPFTDTSNEEVIKANKIGIVFGTGNGKFSPYNDITRQELCVMVYRALDKSIPGLNKAIKVTPKIRDVKLIADWAIEAVKFCMAHEIIKGVGDERVDPLSSTTREQGIVIIKRTFEAFAETASTNNNINFADLMKKVPAVIIPSITNEIDNTSGIHLIDKANMQLSIKLSEEDKLAQIDFSKRLAYPIYDTKLNLFAAKSAGEQALSQAGSQEFSAAPYSCFIDSEGDKKRCFTFDNKATGAVKVIWQVSKVQFNGYRDNWKNPGGLVASGEVAASDGKFIIDFSKFTSDLKVIPDLKLRTDSQENDLTLISSLAALSISNLNNTTNFPPIIINKPKAVNEGIPKIRRTYYVRAVPVDALGQCIGDPGEGLPVIYGKPESKHTKSDIQILNVADFSLLTTNRGGKPTTGGEFPNLFDNKEAHYSAEVTTDNPEWYQWQGLDSSVYKVIIQVSNKPMKNEKNNWDTPAGILYTQSYTDLPINLLGSSLFLNAVPIGFNGYSPTNVEISDGKEAKFYIRAVGLKMSEENPGTVEPLFSNTIPVTFKRQEPIKILQPKTITIPANTPAVTEMSYTPVRWEDPNWASYCIVYRQPEGYIEEIMGSNLASKLGVDSIYPGLGFKVTYNPHESSWWEDLWDAISDFFTDLVNVIADVVNWVSNAYAQLKSGLISFVAQNFPFIPDSLRDELEAALTALVDYGLASMGIPPTLPNFDQLTEDGLDYAVKVMLQENGISVDDLTLDECKELVSQVEGQIEASTNSQTPNPLNYPFVKLHPDYQYRPAYITLKLKNTNAVASPSGTIDVTCNRENYPRYPVFEPVYGQAVPALQPGEALDVIVYIKEFVDKKYGDYYVSHNDFVNAYGGTGQWFDPYGHPTEYKGCEFNISIRYNLPDAKNAAIQNGYDNIPNRDDYILDYKYDRPGFFFEKTVTPSHGFDNKFTY